MLTITGLISYRKPVQTRPADPLPDCANWRRLVGTMPDGVLAKKAGVSRTTVFEYRKSRGIAGVNSRKATWLDELGTMSDKALAAKHDVWVDTVRRARKRRGIPKYEP